MEKSMNHPRRLSILHSSSSILYSLFSILILSSLLLTGGCALFGIAAQAVPKRVKAAYSGLKDQKVAVMVTADRGVRMDWPSVLIDCSSAIQFKMQKLQKEDSPAELSGVVWPWEPRSVVRFQRDHPELELTPAAEIAPKLGVTRLIYVEIVQLTTRSEQASQLFKGKAVANLRVIEVSNGKAKVAYEEAGITVQFPEHGAKEGLLNGDDYRMYLGTLDVFSTAIMNKFVEHDVE